ncbi:MAG: hypothetical protein M3Z64_05990 [Verrucomicrobiota bacterium]|nr:hypothetical protein [Verrucomicrobiota bacterium]
MATALAQPKSDLLFNWGPRRRRKRSIVSFVIASVLLHAFAFYLFQIIYPPTVALLPPPGRLGVISPTTEEGRQLLRWLEAEDPATASMTQRSEAKSFIPPKVAEIPSYVGHQPALKPAPPYQPNLRVPSAHPPGRVIPPPAATAATTTTTPTSITFSPEFETLGAPQFPAFHFYRTAGEPPQAASFRIAVSSTGDLRYSLLQRSSGDDGLDEQACQALALARFPAIQNPESKIQNELIWGSASIEWGNDLAAANPTSADRKNP